MNKLQINVLTPKNQAGRTMRQQRRALLGKKTKDIIQEKLLSDHEFMFVIPYENAEDLRKIEQRLALGETMIKDFYKQLYKFIHLVNRTIKLGNKLGKAGKKGVSWIQRRISKILIQKIPDPTQREEMIKNLELENVEIERGLFKEITINDDEEMKELLSKELIKIKVL